jgi:hypothetical protein
MLISPFLVLEPVKMVHHLSKGRPVVVSSLARVSYQKVSSSTGVELQAIEQMSC